MMMQRADEEIASRVARMMLEVEAVLFNPKTPFIFTSGWASPVYVDCRRLISFPRVRSAITDLAIEKLERHAGYECFDAIAGGETAGIPYAAWIADRMNLPMVYVRKKPKGFGRNARIEGFPVEGKRVLLVEDLATDGRSKMSFVDALREAGAGVSHAFVVFHYGIFPQSVSTLAEQGVALHGLTTWWDVLKIARASGYFAAEDLAEVESFLNDPAPWSAAHGGVSSFGAGS
jgi:orotate phosphoribosyltransferase